MIDDLPEPSRPRIEDGYLRILVVEEDPDLRELIVSTLSQFGFGCQEASDAEEALRILREAAPSRSRDLDTLAEGSALRPVAGRYASLSCDFGLVICDVRMPDRDGVWLLDRVLDAYPDVSVIMLASVDRSRIAVECLRRGATDYLVKPVDMDDLLVSVHQALERRRLLLENRLYQSKLERMVQDRTRELRKALKRLQGSYGETMRALAAALDAREQETAHHSERVAEGCVELLRRLGVRDEETLTVIEQGALLHDIGKIGIPDAILLKDGPLTDEEWRIMREHPIIGYEILQGIQFLEPSLEIVLYHQEKYDGSGYPEGLSGDDIPLPARAFAVVDAWDAMTHQRPYRRPMPHEAAFRELRAHAGSHFDPEVVEAWIELKSEQEHLAARAFDGDSE